MESGNWLILGGVGYIGRNLCEYLLESHLAGHITVADKSIPATSYFHPSHESLFASIELIQTDLSRNPAKAFNKEYQYIVNLSGETRGGLPESRYRQSSIGVIEACKPLIGAAKWIEVSTALVYKSNKRGAREEDALEPWTIEGRWRLEAERALQGVNSVILRVARVYGNGDFNTITPRAILAVVYLRLKQKMKLLWGEDLRINTIHIRDLCRCIVHTKDMQGVFNVSDLADTKQHDISKIIQGLFNITSHYYSRVISNLASLQNVAEEANDMHMPPWAEICAEAGIDCPLYPYVEMENLDGSHVAINSGKLMATGFILQNPEITSEAVRNSLQFLIQARVIPNILI